jgi:hypothetical protein
MRRTSCLLIALAATWAAPASSRLTNSYIRDGVRLCFYDDVRGNYTNPVARSLTVDRNDDCPGTPLPPTVPPLATLQSSFVAGGKQVCSYRYAGRTYQVSINVGMSCTYTPR